MSVHRQSISFAEAAHAFARELVEAGEYSNVGAAASGELAKAKAERDRADRLWKRSWNGGSPSRRRVP